MEREFVILIRWNEEARTTDAQRIDRALKRLTGVINCTAYAINIQSKLLDSILKVVKDDADVRIVVGEDYEDYKGGE